MPLREAINLKSRDLLTQGPGLEGEKYVVYFQILAISFES